MTPRKEYSLDNNRIESHINLQRLQQHIQDPHKFKPDKIPAQRQSPISNQEAIYSWYWMEKGKSVFSNGVSLGILTTAWGRFYAQK